MPYDISQIGAKLYRWESYLQSFSLPSWQELPTIELYMDQVVTLLSEYLNFLPPDEHGNAAITASTVNNYVRLKMMPPPVKKRYNRVHLAYLILICTLKQSVNMTYVQKMIPMGLSPEQVQTLYERYTRIHRKTCEFFLEQTRIKARSVTHYDGSLPDAVEELVFTSAIISGFSKLLTEKIVRLQTEQPAGDSE